MSHHFSGAGENSSLLSADLSGSQSGHGGGMEPAFVHVCIKVVVVVVLNDGDGIGRCRRQKTMMELAARRQ